MAKTNTHFKIGILFLGILSFVSLLIARADHYAAEDEAKIFSQLNKDFECEEKKLKPVKLNSQGEKVKNLQNCLAFFGAEIEVNSVYDSQTQEALKWMFEHYFNKKINGKKLNKKASKELKQLMQEVNEYFANPPQETSPPQVQQQGYKFSVTVPLNTSELTAVFLEFVTDDGLSAGGAFQMERKAANVWGITLKELPRNKYRYNRNEWAFTGAEEFSPDSKTAHRTITSGKKEFNDVVKKWRWLPESDYKITEILTKAEETTFAARVGNEKFQKGIVFSDFWSNNFKRLLASTHASLKKSNVEWIEISPGWKCAPSNPTPLMKSDQYSDEAISFHLNKTKEDGFKILLVAQLSCDTGKNPSDEWWNAWFAQYENYTMYFVDLANKYGIEALVVSGDQIVIGNSLRPADYKQRLENIYSKAKQKYKGKFGRLFVLGGLMDTGFIWPNPKEVPFMENWDFTAVNFWISQTTRKNPTQEELYSNVKTIFEKHLKPLYDSYKKPIVLAQVAYPSIDGGLAGVAGADDPATAVWEPYSDQFALDLEEQAMGHEAIMKNAAKTNYIIGTYAFAYWPDDFPLTKEYNVRGKPAEKILLKYYRSNQ